MTLQVGKGINRFFRFADISLIYETVREKVKGK
jgi:hypothetical protein